MCFWATSKRDWGPRTSRARGPNLSGTSLRMGGGIALDRLDVRQFHVEIKAAVAEYSVTYLATVGMQIAQSRIAVRTSFRSGPFACVSEGILKILGEDDSTWRTISHGYHPLILSHKSIEGGYCLALVTCSAAHPYFLGDCFSLYMAASGVRSIAAWFRPDATLRDASTRAIEMTPLRHRHRRRFRRGS
jgi:hypothetical protein